MLLTVRDTRLFYDVVGSGPLMLAFHGGPGLDHQYLRPWLDPLASVARVAFFDLRGNGRSTGRDTLATSDQTTFCDDADCLRSLLTTDRIILFGHSYGGFLALEYALRYPQRVAGLVLCATAASPAHAPLAVQMAASRNMPVQLASLQAALTRPSASDIDFAESWRAILPLYFHHWNPELADSVFADTVYSAEAYNRAFFGWVAGYDVRERLGEIDVPALVLSGAHDWINSPELAGNELEERLPSSEHVVFEDSGHFPFIEEPQRFAAVTQSWLAKLA